MNTNQIHVLERFIKKVKEAQAKVSDINFKFFRDEYGVLSHVKNSRVNKKLELGIYKGGTGQTIELDPKYEPLLEELLRRIQKDYQQDVDDISCNVLAQELRQEEIGYDFKRVEEIKPTTLIIYSKMDAEATRLFYEAIKDLPPIRMCCKTNEGEEAFKDTIGKIVEIGRNTTTVEIDMQKLAKEVSKEVGKELNINNMNGGL
jgi:hypothetical protein